MEQVLSWGLDVVIAIQSIAHPALTLLMKTLTFLGSEYFYLLVLPLLVWCVDEKRGMRFGFAVILSAYTNEVLKGLFKQPRPYDMKSEVGMVHEESPGLPSGHAQNSVVFFGMLRDFISRKAGIVIAILMPLLIGFSRLYLGVHFPTDVFAGWIIGLLFLFAYRRIGPWIEQRMAKWSPVRQAAAVVLVSAVMTLTSSRSIPLAGVFFGAGIGFILALHTMENLCEAKRRSFTRNALRYVTGIIIAGCIYLGLKAAFPGEGKAFYTLFRFLRYGVLGFWVSFGAPLFFDRIHLT